MYYILYLSGLCRRRHWPEPRYEFYQTTAGYCCTVRVNHREYQTDTVHETDALARENAAMRAYLICRNFSVNDGMYPAGHKGEGGVIQGLPVAIGTGRHSTTYESSGLSSSSSNGGGGGGGGGYISGGSSPRGSDSGREEVVQHVSRLSRSLGYGSREW